jgi:transposase-like protein
MEEKFTIEEIKNFIIAEGYVELINRLTVEHIRRANESVSATATPIDRGVRFKMHCPECERPTPHSLHNNRLAYFKGMEEQQRWTCDICHYQL